MSSRFATREKRHWDIAVLCFRSLKSSIALAQKLKAIPINYETLRGFEGTIGCPQVYETVIEGKRIGIVPQCVWGGPQAAILVEEAAYLGAKHIIGFGAAGGIVSHLTTGTQIVASVGIASDGTTRAYSYQKEVTASSTLLDLLLRVADDQNVEIIPAKIATVDAFYQETEELMALWRNQDVEAINMETSPLYAVSASCGVESLWIGHIADRLLHRKWHSGVRPDSVTTTTIEITIDLLECIVRYL